MVYGSVCSGIEAATAAWHELGWTPAWFSEIEPFPCRVLEYHYPHVPNLGDMLKLHENDTFRQSIIDILVGGTPCQSFSLAGLRGGITDQRGNLALEFCRLLIAKKPRWFVWENVPGVFSSYSDEKGSKSTVWTQTSDFATILQAFSECGYCCAWRVLDAQYFGVPQRRRRVFVVGYLGNDWRPPAAVLFEPQGLRRHPSKGGKKRKDIAGTIGKRTKGGGAGTQEAAAGQLITGTLDASYARLQGASGKDAKHGHSTLIAFGSNNQNGPIQVASALNSKPTRHDFGTETLLYNIMPQNSGKDWKAKISGVAQPLNTQIGASCAQGGDVIYHKHYVRRLTPLECERLQGFEDNYTNIPGAADTPRYESLGNSMARNVMVWIGRRIDNVDKQMKILHGKE